MRIVEINSDIYQQLLKNCKTVFNSVPFIETNRTLVKEIKYLIIYKENSARFAVSFGIKDDNNYYCPFSAPFSYIEPIKVDLKMQDYKEALEALETYFIQKQIKQVCITFPPEFYDHKNISIWLQLMLNNNWYINTVDLNYCFNLNKIKDSYESIIAKNARKNLRISLVSNLTIKECQTEEEFIEAYQIIQLNRSSKGYPLRMTREHVLRTMRVVPSKMFLVFDNEQNLAAALVYDISPTIAQVIYWGDIPGHPEKKVMNYIAYKLIDIYAGRNFEYLDIGPSSENGVLNYGLCDFKDSIGCEESLKFKLTKNFL